MIEVHDIVQITNPEHKWYPALLVIDRIDTKIRGYCHIPMQGDAYVFLKEADIERVGRAVIVAGEEDA